MSDDYRMVNPVLRTVMQKIYDNRTSFPVEYLVSSRIERINNKDFCQLFFLSRGCSHDIIGGCTMCNYGYGKSRKVDPEELLTEMSSALEVIPKDLQEIVVGPIGSMLDDEEVEPEIRARIIEMLSGIFSNEFTCETRVDTITEEKLQYLSKHIHTNQLTLEIGVESIDLWCLRNCINKNITFQQVEQAIKMIHNAGINVCANVAIGQPFLNEKQSAVLAVKTIKKLLELEVDCIVLFAYNIRPGTLLEWLYNQHLYDCSSLWLIPEILSDFSPDELQKIQISWYKNYYNSDKKIIKMPYLCPKCHDTVQKLFDAYRNCPCFDTLKPVIDYQCECKETWYNRYAKQSRFVDFEYVSDVYRKMAVSFSISDDVLERELLYMKSTLLSDSYLN